MADDLGSATPPAPQPPATPPITPPATPPITPPATPPTTPPATPPAPAWHSTFDEETRGWIENRGLHRKQVNEALADMVKTTRSAESKFGVPEDRFVRLPANLNEEGALNPIYDRLGRPKTAAEYGFEAPEATDALGAEFVKTLATSFHEAGLNTTQAKALYSKIDKAVTDIYETQVGTTETQRAAAMTALQAEWGESFEYNKVLAQEAAKAIGATKEELDALEAAFGENGNATVIKLFNRIGNKRGGESAFVNADNPALRYGATTPEAAKAKLEELRADPEWAKKFRDAMDSPIGGNSAIMKEYRALTAVASKAQ